MNGMTAPRLSRRSFLRWSAAGAAAVLLPADLARGAQARPPAGEKLVWVWGDAHIGLNSPATDGQDGAAWLRMACKDQATAVGTPAYILVVGDLTHRGLRSELEKYCAIRKQIPGHGKQPAWYEIVGNHDFAATRGGDYQRLVRKEESYCLEDGNLLWIMISAERSWGRGIICPEKQKWMERIIGRNQDKNIIVCSHQLVANTLRFSDPDKKHDCDRILTPVEWVAGLLKRYRIDAWLCGHEHHRPRDRNQARRIGRTTFINVASMSHAYGTRAANSFTFHCRNGQRGILARCRAHDRKAFLADEFGIRIELPYPLRLAASEHLTRARPFAAASTAARMGRPAGASAHGHA